MKSPTFPCPLASKMTQGCHFMPAGRSFSIVILFLLLFKQGTYAQVTAIYSDYNGYWTTSLASQNPVKPDNSHNLLAFTWNGTTYSTGVNDATLTSKSVVYTPLSFRAFPINTVPNTTAASYFVMLGQLYDGVNAGINSSPTPFPANPTGAQLASFLTDGVKGLNLGTGLANIPASSTLTFMLSPNGITLSAVNDGKPDIFVTEEASPSTTNPDVFKFIDAGGATVGVPVSVITSNLTPIGNWQADFYDLTATQTQSTFINQSRPLAYYAADLSTFGINASNYMNAVALVYQPNGNSDPAFLAFSEPSISVASKLLLTAQPSSYTTNVPVTPAPQIQVRDGQGNAISQSGIPVTATIGTGTGSLTGTVTVNTDASGIASFSNLSITGSGNVSLKFSSSSLDPALSTSITPVILPLNWLSFTAGVVRDGIELQWTTTDEVNTKDFLIQRSSDGSAWQNIGTLPTIGSRNINSYQFTDPVPGQGTNYYRLLQRDLDGKGSYSQIVVISTTGVSEPLVTIYPNPVTNGLLNISLQHDALIILYNNNGQAVLRKQLTAGLQQLNVANLTKGIYSLTAEKVSYKIEIL